jgi:hypothetical protein
VFIPGRQNERRVLGLDTELAPAQEPELAHAQEAG